MRADNVRRISQRKKEIWIQRMNMECSLFTSFFKYKHSNLNMDLVPATSKPIRVELSIIDNIYNKCFVHDKCFCLFFSVKMQVESKLSSHYKLDVWSPVNNPLFPGLLLWRKIEKWVTSYKTNRVEKLYPKLSRNIERWIVK